MKNSKKTHVLFIPSWYTIPEIPLSGIFFKQQARALRKAGYNVGVLVPPVIRNLITKKNLLKPNVFLNLPHIDYENDEGIPTYRGIGWNLSNRINLKNFFFLRTSIKMFNRYISENGRPDILHAHYARFGGVVADNIKLRFKIPFVISEMCSHYAKGLIPENEIPSIKRVFQHADERIMVSPQLGRLLESKIGKVVSPWKYVPNLVEEKYFEPISKNVVCKRKENFSFLNVGMMNLDDNKGHFDLLTSFSKQFKGDKKVELRLCGDGTNRNNLEQLAKKLGIYDQVYFLGIINHEQVKKEIQSSDVFVYPSHYETFGLSVIEALACGKPVITTACGGPENIINKHNGIIVPPRNVNKLGNAMKKIKNNLYLYDPQTIIQDCFNRFSEKTVINKLTDIYNKVLGNENSLEM